MTNNLLDKNVNKDTNIITPNKNKLSEDNIKSAISNILGNNQDKDKLDIFKSVDIKSLVEEFKKVSGINREPVKTSGINSEQVNNLNKNNDILQNVIHTQTNRNNRKSDHDSRVKILLIIIVVILVLIVIVISVIFYLKGKQIDSRNVNFNPLENNNISKDNESNRENYYNEIGKNSGVI